MTITRIGGGGDMTIGGVLPGVSAGLAAGRSGIGVAMPDLQARATALLLFNPAPPALGFAGAIALAQGILASLQQAASLGVSMPSVDVSAAAIAAQLAELGAKLAGVRAQLDIIVGLQGAATGGSVRAYAYDGAVGNFGAEFAVELGASPSPSPGAHCNALVLLTTEPATWVALSQLAKVTP